MFYFSQKLKLVKLAKQTICVFIHMYQASVTNRRKQDIARNLENLDVKVLF